MIYEAHVKGLTLLHLQLPKAIRGIYKVLCHLMMITYFRSLGISTLELLPVAQFASEPRLQRMGLSNYQDYSPLVWSALDPRYASEPVCTLDRLRDVVKALHVADIGVILDIVLNHSMKIDLEGSTVSLRGVDNRNYYWVREDDDYHNWTGYGNTFNLNHPRVVEWARQCLHFWVDEYHADGFRFNLTSVMGWTPKFHQDTPPFEAIRRDSVLSQVKLIAESWGIGPGDYQVANFPPLFAEWNDYFRDISRRFWLQQNVSLDDSAQRLAASNDFFARNGKRPSVTMSLVTARNGFTFHSYACFNQKHNEANREENRDGTSNNYSNNHGIEGLDANLMVIERRRASVHALLTTLLLTQGTPMLLAGNEQGYSQHGNNNTCCQDNALAWLGWRQANPGLTVFTAVLIHLHHRVPTLACNRWWQGGDDNVRWLSRNVQPLTAGEWQQGTACMQIQLSDRWLLTLNATTEVVDMVLPKREWRAVPPFAGEDNPVVVAIWHGPAYGVYVFQKS